MLEKLQGSHNDRAANQPPTEASSPTEPGEPPSKKATNDQQCNSRDVIDQVFVFTDVAKWGGTDGPSHERFADLRRDYQQQEAGGHRQDKTNEADRSSVVSGATTGEVG